MNGRLRLVQPCKGNLIPPLAYDLPLRWANSYMIGALSLQT